jgi:hypothetical protein
VAAFLQAEGARVRRWHPPGPDADVAEAEWGYQPELSDDVRRVADRHGWQVETISFDHADDLSPFVADLYRWWYRRLGRPTNRLFVESFVLLDPYWVLRAAAVPYWITFNAEPGAERLGDYLDQADPYDVIEAALISNGTSTVDQAGPRRWVQVLERARVTGRLAGVDASRFPTDFGVFARYRDTLRHSQPRYPVPAPLSVPDFQSFAADRAGATRVRFGARPGPPGPGDQR